MRISGYCHNSSTGIKLIILLLLILWGALIVAIPMFFVKGSNALLIAMYLHGYQQCIRAFYKKHGNGND